MAKWIENKGKFSLFTFFPVYPFRRFALPVLVPHQPAIDVKRLAGDVAGLV